MHAIAMSGARQLATIINPTLVNQVMLKDPAVERRPMIGVFDRLPRHSFRDFDRLTWEGGRDALMATRAARSHGMMDEIGRSIDYPVGWRRHPDRGSQKKSEEGLKCTTISLAMQRMSEQRRSPAFESSLRIFHSVVRLINESLSSDALLRHANRRL